MVFPISLDILTFWNGLSGQKSGSGVLAEKNLWRINLYGRKTVSKHRGMFSNFKTRTFSVYLHGSTLYKLVL